MGAYFLLRKNSIRRRMLFSLVKKASKKLRQYSNASPVTEPARRWYTPYHQHTVQSVCIELSGHPHALKCCIISGWPEQFVSHLRMRTEMGWTMINDWAWSRFLYFIWYFCKIHLSEIQSWMDHPYKSLDQPRTESPVLARQTDFQSGIVGARDKIDQ